MTKILSMLAKVTCVVLVVGIFFNIASWAHASTPVLTATPTGNGDSVQLTVTGDPNAGVIFFYYETGQGRVPVSLGTTDGSGNLSATISTAQDNVELNSVVFVTTAGINGPQSNQVTWPINSSSTTTTSFSLSQAGIVLTVGQSSVVTAYNNTAGSLYLASNSNPPIASVNISGNQITVLGNVAGSAVATICGVGNTTNCPTLSITVQNTGASTLSFSQNNITISSGQNTPITITGGNGVYTILNNSNQSAVQATMNNATITLATTATTGSASITICSTDMSSCGVLNVSIGGASSSGIYFTDGNPTIAAGASENVTVSGGPAGSVYYISSNSNSGVAQVRISNGVLAITGTTNGTSTINVCSSVSGCGTVTVTVTYVSAGGPLLLSQSSINLLVGQPLSVVVSGGTTPYRLPLSSDNVFQATLNGNILTVTGESVGTSSVSVCGSDVSCVALAINVTTNGSTNNMSAIPVTFSPTSLSLVVGQNSSTLLSGGSGSGYYVAFNSNSAVAQVAVSGNALSVTPVTSGGALVVICTSANNCGALPITIGGTTSSSTSSGWIFCANEGQPCNFTGTREVQYGANGRYAVGTYASSVTCLNATFGDPAFGVAKQCSYSQDNVTTPLTPLPTSAPTPASVAVAHYQFNNPLVIGGTGPEVVQLQQRLTLEGVYTGPTNGNYGPLTEAAVKAYQTKHGLDPLGNVGPGTRAALNAP